MVRIGRRLKAFVQMPGPERILAVEARALFWTFRVALQVVPFRWFRSLVGPGATPSGAATASSVGVVDARAESVGRHVRAAARRRPDACLAEALTARAMLRRRAVSSVLSFGVMEGREDELRFHAWLTHGGERVTGGSTEEYTLLSTHIDDPVQRDEVGRRWFGR